MRGAGRSVGERVGPQSPSNGGADLALMKERIEFGDQR
jgi:hypothetical protein